MIGYGFFPGGDPRNFTPDEELCTPQEIEAHRSACEAMDKGGVIDAPSGCIILPGGVFLNISRFGMGTYSIDDDDDEDEIESPL